jgi:hypothetical protein
LSQAMLILVDAKDLVGLIRALQGEPEKPATTPLSTLVSPSIGEKPPVLHKTIPETATLPDTFFEDAPTRFCCECGEYFEPDDMVVEYFVDDGSDEFKAWYHKGCEPTERALSIYRSAKKIREFKAGEIETIETKAKRVIEKVKGNNPGKAIVKQKYTTILGIIKSANKPISCAELFKKQNEYSNSGLYHVLEKMVNDGKLTNKDNCYAIKEGSDE